MARQAVSAFIPAGDADIKETVNATSAGAVHTIGKNRLFAINATQDITIAFGISSGGGAVSATANNFRIPAGVTMLWDMGSAYDQFQVFNTAASSATVYAKLLSVV